MFRNPSPVTNELIIFTSQPPGSTWCAHPRGPTALPSAQLISRTAQLLEELRIDDLAKIYEDLTIETGQLRWLSTDFLMVVPGSW